MYGKKKVLEIYKENLKPVDMDNIEPVNDIEVKNIPQNIKPNKYEIIDNPDKLKQGDIIEIIPSIDGNEILFYVYGDYKNGCVEIMPVTRYVELVEISSSCYTVINDTLYAILPVLPYTIYKETFISTLQELGYKIIKIKTVNDDEKHVVNQKYRKYDITDLELNNIELEFYELENERINKLLNMIFDYIKKNDKYYEQYIRLYDDVEY